MSTFVSDPVLGSRMVNKWCCPYPGEVYCVLGKFRVGVWRLSSLGRRLPIRDSPVWILLVFLGSLPVKRRKGNRNGQREKLHGNTVLMKASVSLMESMKLWSPFSITLSWSKVAWAILGRGYDLVWGISPQ